jgi:transposase-like protein
MKRRRKRRSPVFKAKVALEATRGRQTLDELARQFEAHPVQVSHWKRRLKENACAAFSGPAARNAMRDRCCQEIKLSQQTTRHEESWMMDVLQGKLSVARVATELAPVIPCEVTEQLCWCVESRPAHYRTRALAMLAHNKGIRTSTIWHFLRVGSHYVDSVVRHYQDEGINWFGKHGRKGQRKHELERYREAVFAILHSPPSAHGINRTTWRRRDIIKVMAKQHTPIGKNGLVKIIRNAGYKFCKAKVCLTSNDPHYEKKVRKITGILAKLRADEKFFSIDEFGPFAVKMQGGRSFMKPDQVRVVPQFQKSKGVLILTAALELSENQVTHFYSPHKNTDEMVKLLDLLLEKYADQSRIYLSWDAASWHASKRFIARVKEINSAKHRAVQKCPRVKLAPLPSRAQFLNVIESVFSGMAKAVIHNSDYQSVAEAVAAIDRHFAERNQEFKEHPKRAGGKIWGGEIVVPKFREANNCKAQRYMNSR